jgi:RNA polymerase sigma factor (sigma-70 family)
MQRMLCRRYLSTFGRTQNRFDEAKASETTFVAMLARRRLIDRIRYSTRRITADSLDDVLLEPFTRSDQQMQMAAEASQAAEAMRSLRPEQQQVLRLSIIQGMSHQEISEATGMRSGPSKHMPAADCCRYANTWGSADRICPRRWPYERGKSRALS